MDTSILSYANSEIAKYSHLYTFGGTVIGVLGLVVGLYNWWKKNEIIRLRQKVVSAHFQNIRKFKNDFKSYRDVHELFNQYSNLYNNFLEMFAVIMAPTKQELTNWLEKGYIDKSDHDYLRKINVNDL